MRLVAILLAAILSLATVPARAADLSDYVRPPLPERITVPTGAHLVEYRAEADNGASLTYMVGGATEQRTIPRSGSLRFVAFPGDFLYLSVQNAQASGEVKCRILVDWQVVKEATSDGAYSIATCQYMLPQP